jgi:hypothetical protein
VTAWVVPASAPLVASESGTLAPSSLNGESIALWVIGTLVLCLLWGAREFQKRIAAGEARCVSDAEKFSALLESARAETAAAHAKIEALQAGVIAQQIAAGERQHAVMVAVKDALDRNSQALQAFGSGRYPAQDQKRG